MTKQLASSKLLFPFFICCLLFSSICMTSCGGDDDDNNVECESFPSLEGSIDINGESLALSVAQRLVQATGSAFGDQYTFQVAGVTSDCKTQQSINIFIGVPSGASLTGTYAINTFFDAAADEATGSFVTQSIDPISQSLVDIDSGTLTIVDNGDASYEIDVDGTLAGGGVVSMSIQHQF